MEKEKEEKKIKIKKSKLSAYEKGNKIEKKEAHLNF